MECQREMLSLLEIALVNVFFAEVSSITIKTVTIEPTNTICAGSLVKARVGFTVINISFTMDSCNEKKTTPIDFLEQKNAIYNQETQWKN